MDIFPPDDDDLPEDLRDPLTRLRDGAAARVAEGVDRLFVRMAFQNPLVGRRAARPSVLSRIESAGAFYQRQDQAGALFPEPPPAPLQEMKLRPLVGGHVLDVWWPSGWTGLDASHRRTLDRCPENAQCKVRWFRHDRPAPAMICLHGWGAGYPGLESQAFFAPWLYEQGLDVLLFVLPFHSRRLPAGRATPMFPTLDPVRTSEGFAQAVHDVRALVGALLRRGAPAVGVSGMSLGGYTSALLATVEPRLAFVAPIVAFASIAALLWEHIGETGLSEAAAQRNLTEERLAAALAPVTPLCRAPAIDPARMLLLAGERDRVTPLRHSEALQAHFPGSTLHTFPGAHVLQVGRRGSLPTLVSFLERAGILRAR